MFPDGATKATIRQRTARAISRLRFTLMFLAAMLIANFASGSIGGDLPHEILEAWGIGHDSLLSGEAFRLLTGPHCWPAFCLLRWRSRSALTT